MKLIEILKILRDEAITIDFLGDNKNGKIINTITQNPQLVSDIERIPDNFWEESKQKGLLLYEDYTFWTDSNKSIGLSSRHHDINEGKKHVNALVLQRKKQVKIK